MTSATGLGQRTLAILQTAAPAGKVRLTEALWQDWQAGLIRVRDEALPPPRPARPERPLLLAPKQMPKRGKGGRRSRIALLHALAHIELNAIDLAIDLICRFQHLSMPHRFIADWLKVAADEARHFTLLESRLQKLGSNYGALPAHDGLWQAAESTRHCLLARLAVVPMVLEARGLDVTPTMIASLERLGDGESADILRQIYRDEVTHVATGQRWFAWVCAQKKRTPTEIWPKLVRRYFRGQLKPPFNDAARQEAGIQAYLDAVTDPRVLPKINIGAG